MSTPAPVATNRWVQAWPDALAFAVGLGLAWHFAWSTTDLIWSLWLSSLVVGSAMIAWGAFSPAWLHFHERNVGSGVYGVFDGLAKVIIFMGCFGFFHAGHAAFLNWFFPLGARVESAEFPELAQLGEVVLRYGVFVPVALLAERRVFRFTPMPPEPPRTSVKAADIEVRKARQGYGGEAIFLPYLNVMRMHLLLMSLGCVHFAKMESFGVYAVVYAVYFFPWRLLLRAAPVEGGKSR